MRSLLVVGSVALDDVDGPFGRHPDILGGSASFFSVAASFFTKEVHLVAVVGDDFPEEHVEYLRSCGVDCAGLERVAGKTFRWAGRYSDDLSSRQTLDTQLGVFAGFKPKLDEAHKNAELVFLGNIDPVLQLDVLEQVKRPRLVACDTMNFWIGGKRADLEKTLARVDVLIANDEEARQLAGTHNLVKAATTIRKLGPRTIVIKRGDAGALLFDGAEQMFFAPALPLENVKDPTGAGDTFAGGFMGYLARAAELSPQAIRHAMIFGSVMASYSVEDFSLDRLRTLKMDDVARRFRAFHDLVRFDQVDL